MNPNTPQPSREAVEAAKEIYRLSKTLGGDTFCHATAEVIDRALSAQREAHEREVAELNKKVNTLKDFGAEALTQGTENIDSLRSRLAALEEDRARYEFLRKDPPSELAVRKKVIRDGMERILYIDGENLDYAIDAARNASKEGV